ARSGSGGEQWVMVDGYHFQEVYQQSIKETGCRLLWMDDCEQSTHYCADLVLNQNIAADPVCYASRDQSTRLLLGPHYALLRREFQKWSNWLRKIPPVAQKILVTLGGGDLSNVTLKMIKALKMIKMPELYIKVIVGPANPHGEELGAAISDDPRFDLLAGSGDISELMSWADLGVSAGGSTSWELAFMGLPQVLVCLAENQRSNAEVLARESISVNLGWHANLKAEDISRTLEQVIRHEDQRSVMSQKGRDLVDGYGAWRVVGEMCPVKPLRLRAVCTDDCEMVWKWANDPITRNVSYSPAEIPWDEHRSWFQKRSSQPFYYIALNHEGIPVGQARFDEKGDEMVISVAVDAGYRNRGYGSSLIKAACREVFQKDVADVIHAYVKHQNPVSRKAFIRAGFSEGSDVVHQDCPSFHLVMRRPEGKE
ncbi:UDP-2,4-diacetamido-2,4,6-trideoxy-beta-L-altropyranose hydrolase, partial [archaeon]|nr:UDP-2,4-diacetamido-2,4,6-trideoxy-beta-L-altropyranose hydrolase [archaeon]